jgi:hypothetical protein
MYTEYSSTTGYTVSYAEASACLVGLVVRFSVTETAATTWSSVDVVGYYDLRMINRDFLILVTTKVNNKSE